MRTCNTSSHRAFEQERRERGQAIFRLRRRHERNLERSYGSSEVDSRTSSGNGVQDSVTSVLDDPDVAAVLENDLQGRGSSWKPPTNPKKAQAKTLDSLSKKAAINRRWTHNEQLLVRTCGVVISRATFYEAESPSNVVVSGIVHDQESCILIASQRFLLATFPTPLPRAQPSYCFFDSACILLKHLSATEETRLDNIAFVVDVFHALTKHKDTDTFCQVNCNPAAFPELYNQLLEWLYNSSACEQTNGWFGQFLPIVREMGEVNYNFFLDEMIVVHNEWQVGVLEARGARPRLVPMDELRLPRE